MARRAQALPHSEEVTLASLSNWRDGWLSQRGCNHGPFHVVERYSTAALAHEAEKAEPPPDTFSSFLNSFRNRQSVPRVINFSAWT
jgi:hypothetical protein